QDRCEHEGPADQRAGVCVTVHGVSPALLLAHEPLTSVPVAGLRWSADGTQPSGASEGGTRQRQTDIRNRSAVQPADYSPSTILREEESSRVGERIPPDSSWFSTLHGTVSKLLRIPEEGPLRREGRQTGWAFPRSRLREWAWRKNLPGVSSNEEDSMRQQFIAAVAVLAVLAGAALAADQGRQGREGTKGDGPHQKGRSLGQGDHPVRQDQGQERDGTTREDRPGQQTDPLRKGEKAADRLRHLHLSEAQGGRPSHGRSGRGEPGRRTPPGRPV